MRRHRLPALARGRAYLICDEMTAVLDASTTAALVRVVDRRVHEHEAGVLAISHDEDLLGHSAVHVVRLNGPM
jgi:peptide/nickel transport system ATP-binding protein